MAGVRFPTVTANEQGSVQTERGFSLLELIVGAAALLLALVGIIGGAMSTSLLAEIARDRNIALNDARQVMEEIGDTAFSSIPGTDWTAWAVANGVATLPAERVEVASTALAADLLQVTATVFWQTRARPMSVSVVTLRFRE